MRKLVLNGDYRDAEVNFIPKKDLPDAAQSDHQVIESEAN